MVSGTGAGAQMPGDEGGGHPDANSAGGMPSTGPAPIRVAWTVNGEPRVDWIPPNVLLVAHLRESLGLTGTHIGCDTSNCGACTVLVDDHAVKSCTMLAVQANGADIKTIEGIAARNDDGNVSLHPLQQAFAEEHGLQCGFCTPGMIMSALDLIQDAADAAAELDDATIRHGLEGNICRCTGYQGIVSAVRVASERMKTASRSQGH